MNDYQATILSYKKRANKFVKNGHKNLFDRSETMSFWVGEEGEVKKASGWGVKSRRSWDDIVNGRPPLIIQFLLKSHFFRITGQFSGPGLIQQHRGWGLGPHRSRRISWRPCRDRPGGGRGGLSCHFWRHFRLLFSSGSSRGCRRCSFGGLILYR